MATLDNRLSAKPPRRSLLNEPLLRRIMVVLVAILIVYALLVTLAAYTRTTSVRSLAQNDDGIWAVMARGQATGQVFYRDFWNNKPPVNIFIISIFVGALGNTLAAMNAALIFTLVAFVICSGLVAYQLSGSRLAALIGVAIALLYTGAQDGLDATITMAAFGALAVAVALAGRGRLLVMLLSGLIFGLGFMTKQPVGFEMPALLLFAMIRTPGPWRRKLVSAVAVGVGFALLMGLILLWTVANGMTDLFWFHVFGSTWKYVGGPTGTDRFSEYGLSFIGDIFLDSTLPYMAILFILGAISAIVLLIVRRRDPIIWVTFLWVILSFGAAAVQLALRPEYFRETIPPFIALIALALAALQRRASGWQVPFAALALIGAVWFGYEYVGGLSLTARPPDVTADHQRVIDYVNANTAPSDCLLEWGNLNDILFLSGHYSCTANLLDSNVMVTTVYPTRENQIEFIQNLFDHPPTLTLVRSGWGFFPELQNFADRYVSPQAADIESHVSIYKTDLSKMHRTSANFGGEIGLVAYDLPPKAAYCPGETLPTALTWQLLATPNQQYQAFVQVVTADETAQIAGWDGIPAEERPTNTWVNVGEYVLGPTFELQLPADAAPGTYRLIAGLYDVETQARVSTLGADGQPDGSYARLQDIVIQSGC